MITIRKAQRKEAGILRQLWEEFQIDHDNITDKNNTNRFRKKKQEAADIFEAHIKKKLHAPNAAVFLALSGNEPAGYLACWVQKTIPIFETQTCGYISDIFVRKTYRGIKVSSLMKETAYEWFRKKGIRHITLQVHPANEVASRAYASWGFTPHLITLHTDIDEKFK